MTLFLTYELKVAVLIAIFYIFWRLLVANETLHRLNRIVLLSTAVASFVLPLCVITIHQTVLVEGGGWMVEGDFPEAGFSPSAFNLPSAIDVSRTGQPFNWQLLLTLIYIIGVIVVLSKMLLSLWRLHRMTAESEIHPLADGRQIAVCEKAKTPFSWWKTVFLNHQDFEEGPTALLTHELGHLQMHHSVDVLLVELLTSLQWFNPTMWMLRADLRAIHEYEADQQVLSHGFNDIQYLQLLIRKAAGQSGYSLANGISNSALKKRINMMLQTKSPRRNSLKLLAMLPIVGITLALNAETVTDVLYKNDEPQKQVPVKRGKRNATIKTSSNQVIQVIQDKNVTKPDDENMTLQHYTVENLETDLNPAVLILNTKQAGEEPLLILDGKIATIDQVRALPRDAVSSVATMRERAAIRSYGEKGKNGALIITTVKHQEEVDNEEYPARIMGVNSTIDLGFPKTDDVLDEVDEMPRFPGGMAGLMQYLSTNVRYPEDAKEAGNQGLVIVGFIVEKDGSISNARVTKPTYSSLDEEALRVISAMPKWTPAKQNGEAVRMEYSLPVSFRLKDKDLLSEMSESPSFEDLTKRLPGAEIDENGKITINGKEVKRIMIDGSDIPLATTIANIMLNDAEHFDYEIDGVPISVKDLEEKKSPQNPIKSVEYVQRDSEHPKDRLLITTKTAE